MRESMATFVVTPQNEAAVQAMREINGMSPIPRKIFLTGPAGAGKSTLIRGLGEDAIRNGAEMMLFSCSGADIALALRIEADDSFFERLGETPVLLLDDLGPLLRHEKGDQLLSLLLAERDRLKLTTVVASRAKMGEMDAPLSLPQLVDFEVITMEPLDEKGKEGYVLTAMEEYRNSNSPAVAPEAVTFIAQKFGARFIDMENAARYLMTDEDCAALGTITGEKAAELLQA